MSRERESQGRGSKKQEFVHNKEEANFQTSGVLVKEANTFNGVTLKYSEPAEGRKWPSNNKHLLRLYVFKADSHIDTIPLHKQSAYLLGRERYTC
jgi:smad nuclear-interacting protein 1